MTVNNEAVKCKTLIEAARNDALALRDPRWVTINYVEKKVTTTPGTTPPYTLPPKVMFLNGINSLTIYYDAFGTLETYNEAGKLAPLDAATPSLAFYLTNKTATLVEKVTIYRNGGAVDLDWVPITAGTYTITASAWSGGTVTPPGVTTENYGASQVYTITPATGYHIASLTVDGSAATIATTYTFANITINHTISATFTSTFTLTYTAGANCTITGTTPQTVNY